jgi:hypothetical protein
LSVVVFDQRKRPVMPCCEKRARLLLERGRAVVHCRYPFTIRLQDPVGGDVEPVPVKLDPVSRTTGIAVVATKLTAHGFSRGYCMRTRSVRGFQTGDMGRVEMPTGNKAGTHVGRAAVGGSGSLRVGNADAINARYCKLLHRADGYCYARQPALPPRPEERGLKRGRL